MCHENIATHLNKRHWYLISGKYSYELQRILTQMHHQCNSAKKSLTVQREIIGTFFRMKGLHSSGESEMNFKNLTTI